MSRSFKQLVVAACLLALASGCATAPSTSPENAAVSPNNKDARTRNVLLAVGGLLVVGAILVNEAEDGVEQAVRQVTLP